ncbi:MAG: metallophosphoesterase family protein [Krumholzibacteria bacterium]|nr:metallophosphoesterase family protein [Candidatus Krumholzibacteria bacterium]
MRIAVISDIHSNLQALEAVLARIDALGCGAVYCLGDIVGYGAHPAECVARVRATGAVCIQGNHDALVADGSLELGFNPRSLQAVTHNRGLLDQETLAWLAALPVRRDLDQGTVLAHGSPGDRDRYLLFARDLELVRREQEAEAGDGITFFGHTHQPVCFAGAGFAPQVPGSVPLLPDGRVLVNPGSVGQPRDGDPRAALLVWHRDDRRLDFERIDYDIETARREIILAGLPERLGDRLREGR